MIPLKTFLSIAIFNFIIISCNKNDDTVTPIEQPTVFNSDNYTEYVSCKVGDFQYNTGNNAGNTTSISAFKVGSTLYLSASDGNFISGTTLPMEINFQLKNFDAVNPKSYEVSGTFPTEILKNKHLDGDNYDTNNGVNTAPQANSITITKIENGFYSGTFTFISYKISNRATTLQASQGKFKFKI